MKAKEEIRQFSNRLFHYCGVILLIGITMLLLKLANQMFEIQIIALIFLLPVMLGLFGARWFKSRTVTSPVAKCMGALALLVFFALCLQCVSTIAVMRKETGSWRWPRPAPCSSRAC